MDLYHEGDTVAYTTAARIGFWTRSPAQKKNGTIREQFYTAYGEPCYWISGEPELILQRQIVGKSA